MMPPKTHRARKLTAAALLAVMGVFLILPSADVAEQAVNHKSQNIVDHLLSAIAM